MPDGILSLFAARPAWQIVRDVLDVLIVAWVIYRALLVLRGTRAIQMAVGLGIVLLVYLAAKKLQLVTLLNLLSWLLSSLILIVVVIFQNDIRRALIRMGGTAWFTGGREQQSRVIDEVVAAATELARHRMGALIAFEQDANVLEFAKSEGIQLDCVVTRELLVSLFVPESVNKLHDGAVLIRDLKIARAGVFFPMPDTKILDAQLGSRHRAALGITEETDAVVVVVSEERGTISFCFSGNIVSNLDGQSLRHALLGLFGRSARKKQQRGAKKTPGPAPALMTGEAAAAPKSTTPAKQPGPAKPSLAAKTTSGAGRVSSTSIPLSSAAVKTPGAHEATKPITGPIQRASGPEPTAGPPSKMMPSTPMRSVTDSPMPGAAVPMRPAVTLSDSSAGPPSAQRPTFVPSAPIPRAGQAGPDDEGGSSPATPPPGDDA